MPMAGSVTHAVLPAFTAAPVAVSATLAVNEALAKKQQAGVTVLPLAFGEAGLPVHGALREALAAATGRGDYGPVAGLPSLREAAAGCPAVPVASGLSSC